MQHKYFVKDPTLEPFGGREFAAGDQAVQIAFKDEVLPLNAATGKGVTFRYPPLSSLLLPALSIFKSVSIPRRAVKTILPGSSLPAKTQPAALWCSLSGL
jgi:hypothetical protein